MKRFGCALVLSLMVVSCNRSEQAGDAAATNTDPASSGASSAAAPAATNTDPAGRKQVPPQDMSFATTASMANLYEIEASRLAEQKVTSDQYRQFATTMIAQHTEIGDSYKPIAEKQGLPMPTALEGSFKDLYDQLAAAKTAAEFESLYRTQMVDSHQSAVGLFEDESASGQDPQLEAFAARWLPTVRHHLEMAKQLPQPSK